MSIVTLRLPDDQHPIKRAKKVNCSFPSYNGRSGQLVVVYKAKVNLVSRLYLALTDLIENYNHFRS